MEKNRLREYRELAGMSQVELGRRARLANQNISGFERGTLAVWAKARKALAKALKVSEAELFPTEKGGGNGAN